jgi:hypothetical protein
MNILTDSELLNVPVGNCFVFDVESYENLFFIAFKDIHSKKIVTFELSRNSNINYDKLQWFLWRFLLVGFNSNCYDLPIIMLALQGKSTSELKFITNEIISNEMRRYDLEKKYKISLPKINHIDLIEVCPLKASLKTYGGRLHCQRMQDLPYPPDAILTAEQAQVVREYCVNDLDNTELILFNLKDQLNLRYELSKEYGQDLRSKSDAQIAEAVITNEVGKLKGYIPRKPVIKEGTAYEYNIPAFIHYRNNQLSDLLKLIKETKFVIDKNGSPKLPKSIESRKINIGNSTYRIGIGGLHSSEKSIAHLSDDDHVLIDRDVESYYPRIIINQRLFPAHMGDDFLKVYERLVSRRIDAKRSGNSVVADSLKITINGSFGKLGSRYSALYAPDLMLQVTISGQLCLLMLIDRIEHVGIPVVSANTDGIVIKCPRLRETELNEIITQWEIDTRFKTEETRYKAVYSRDVNNYIAVKEDGKVKSKGAYSNPWSDPKTAIFRFHKNPQTTIVIEAVIDFITKSKPIEASINESNNISKFVIVRNVKGGAVKDGNYLGKVVRWYYAKGEKGAINYALNGNKVALSDGSTPLMQLPATFPNDVNYEKYIIDAQEILFDIGYFKKRELGKLWS